MQDEREYIYECLLNKDNTANHFNQMIFTWSSKDLCIVFRQWHITGPWSLLLSLLAIVLLTAGYEGVRQITRRYEVARAQRLGAFSTTVATGGTQFAFSFTPISSYQYQ